MIRMPSSEADPVDNEQPQHGHGHRRRKRRRRDSNGSSRRFGNDEPPGWTYSYGRPRRLIPIIAYDFEPGTDTPGSSNTTAPATASSSAVVETATPAKNGVNEEAWRKAAQGRGTRRKQKFETGAFFNSLKAGVGARYLTAVTVGLKEKYADVSEAAMPGAATQGQEPNRGEEANGEGRSE